MIDDEPSIAVLDVSETVARRQSFRLAIVAVGECVIAGVDSHVAVHSDQLVAKRNLEARKNLESRHEVLTQGCAIRAHIGRQCSPQDGVLGVVGQYLVGIVFTLGRAPMPMSRPLRLLLVRLTRAGQMTVEPCSPRDLCSQISEKIP